MRVAIIPARAGSKRVAKKNKKLLAGKPLIEWTILAANRSNLFDCVIVSSDDDEILSIARDNGLYINGVRPLQLASDHATSNDVVGYEIAEFERRNGTSATEICLLQPTSPLRSFANINDSYSLFQETGADAVVSVTQLNFPLNYCGYLAEDGSLTGTFDLTAKSRSQDYPIAVKLNGAIYWFRRSLVGNFDELYRTKTLPYLMDHEMSIDIDTEEDFRKAEEVLLQSKATISK